MTFFSESVVVVCDVTTSVSSYRNVTSSCLNSALRLWYGKGAAASSISPLKSAIVDASLDDFLVVLLMKTALTKQINLYFQDDLLMRPFKEGFCLFFIT